MTFDNYLKQPCDVATCYERATHNQGGGVVCNKHLKRDEPAFARND